MNTFLQMPALTKRVASHSLHKQHIFQHKQDANIQVCGAVPQSLIPKVQLETWDSGLKDPADSLEAFFDYSALYSPQARSPSAPPLQPHTNTTPNKIEEDSYDSEFEEREIPMEELDTESSINGDGGKNCGEENLQTSPVSPCAAAFVAQTMAVYLPRSTMKQENVAQDSELEEGELVSKVTGELEGENAVEEGELVEKSAGSLNSNLKVLQPPNAVSLPPSVAPKEDPKKKNRKQKKEASSMPHVGILLCRLCPRTTTR